MCVCVYGSRSISSFPERGTDDCPPSLLGGHARRLLWTHPQQEGASVRELFFVRYETPESLSPLYSLYIYYPLPPSLSSDSQKPHRENEGSVPRYDVVPRSLPPVPELRGNGDDPLSPPLIPSRPLSRTLITSNVPVCNVIGPPFSPLPLPPSESPVFSSKIVPSGRRVPT